MQLRQCPRGLPRNDDYDDDNSLNDDQNYFRGLFYMFTNAIGTIR